MLLMPFAADAHIRAALRCHILLPSAFIYYAAACRHYCFSICHRFRVAELSFDDSAHRRARERAADGAMLRDAIAAASASAPRRHYYAYCAGALRAGVVDDDSAMPLQR
jgi:hypothetical protein